MPKILNLNKKKFIKIYLLLFSVIFIMWPLEFSLYIIFQEITNIRLFYSSIIYK